MLCVKKKKIVDNKKKHILICVSKINHSLAVLDQHKSE